MMADMDPWEPWQVGTCLASQLLSLLPRKPDFMEFSPKLSGS